ncbi:hypothetical protein [Duganella callida]|uniref:Lipoprotein n=1 Tax=Duganella callida TaxID=2561932 RepID=A0A4Y9SCI5_9BURK|nr:hypothetical protein [Duganella callida]TFW18409.1 hypothetical protein E4L98_18310 [Duganella callida]
MKRIRYFVLMLCLTAVAGCANKMSDSGTGSGYTSGDMGRSGMQTAANTGSSGAMQQQQSWNGVVQSIDQMQRQDVGVGTIGAAAAGGNLGAPTDKVYRVTIRTEDGSSQQVVVESMPNYKVGDRVRYSNGMVQPATQ